MSQGIVAQRYAKALIGLTKTRKELEEAGEKLSEASEAYQSSVELQEILASNKVSYPVKQKILGELLERLKTSTLIHTFCRYLLSKRRFELIPSISRAYYEMFQAKIGRIEAQVSVTHELSDASRKKLEKTLSSLTGKEVQVSVNIDSGLIGGIVTRIGSTVYDGSLRNQLNLIHQSISKGGTL
ncbi:MAG: ATP synthase F1 subunit delta [SAR324 cluster bacterium]|nr:ATP synthase F1 subunit delta [SAR324 cluster bacterium]